jgi:hypothetical protein
VVAGDLKELAKANAEFNGGMMNGVLNAVQQSNSKFNESYMDKLLATLENSSPEDTTTRALFAAQAAHGGSQVITKAEIDLGQDARRTVA